MEHGPIEDNVPCSDNFGCVEYPDSLDVDGIVTNEIVLADINSGIQLH
jgi:hypothetical protein